jgi:carbamoyl-phosphate synthase large subunit
MQVHEAAWTVAALHLAGVDSISAVLPGHMLVFRPGGEVLDAVVTPSCSAVLSLLGLLALTVAVLRSRRLHAVLGLGVAAAAVLVTNDLRLAASALAGLAWGGPALVLFHDWVGTVWNFAATLGGFLLMVSLTLPESRRAEQDLAGRHTARRPTAWARPGLGYRAGEEERAAARGGRSLTGLVHRYLLPRPVTRLLAAHREAARIDYRLGHLPAAERAERVRALAADGLGAHTATLLAVATYETDPAVLDALGAAVAARQWEPVTGPRVAALRLWARGWTHSRRLAAEPPVPVVQLGRPPVPPPTGPPTRPPLRVPARHRAAAPPVPGRVLTPSSFARPAPCGRHSDPEDPR